MFSNARAGNRSSSCSSPFTATQWQELEHQALIYKYMVSGVPIPPELLFSVKRSLDSSLSSIGWGCFQVGFGKKGDPEPGRCRRTDGKKWRCSKEAHPGSKYCDRHMHRGRNRSRKPVEITSSSSPSPSPSTITNTPRTSPISNTTPSNNSYYHNPYLTAYNNPSWINPLSISSSTSSLDSDVHQQAPLNGQNFLNTTFLYNNSNSSSCSDSSSCCKTTSTAPNLFIDSLSSSHHHHPASDKDYRYLQGVREDQQLHHHQYGSSPQPEFDNFYSYPSSKQDYHQHCFVLGADFNSSSSSSISDVTNRPLIKVEESSSNSKEDMSSSSHKPMHHFFGLGGGADSWLDLASSSRPS